MTFKPAAFFGRAVPAAGFGKVFGRAGAAVGPTVPGQFGAGQWSLTDPQTAGDLTLTVSSLPSNGGSALTDLQARIDGGAAVSAGSTSPGTFNIANLTDGVQSGVEIRAVNAVGPGPWSAVKTATPTSIVTAAAPRLLWFATSDGDLDNGSPGLINELNKYQATGVRGFRSDWRYANIWNGTTNDWSRVDSWLDAAATRGLKHMPILSATAAALDSPAERTAFATWCGQAAAHLLAYPFVTDIEFLNEPTNPGPYVPVADYTAALIAAYPLIKAANPNIRVWAGSLGPIESPPPANHQGALDFANYLIANAINSMDGLSYHVYCEGQLYTQGSDDAAWHTKGILRRIEGAVAASARPQLQIAITEFGTETVVLDTEQEQVVMIRDMVRDLSQRRSVADFLAEYMAYNRVAEAVGQDGFGVLRANGDGKRVYRDWQDLCALYNDDTPTWEILPERGTQTLPLWRWFQELGSGRRSGLTISILEALPAGFSLAAGALTVNPAVAAPQLNTPLTVVATHSNGAVATFPLTVTVFYPNLLTNGEFGIAGNITGWAGYSAASTVSYDAFAGSLVCDITAAGGGAQLETPGATVLNGVVYEFGALLKKGTYGGTQLNVFMGGSAATPTSFTPSGTEYTWHWATRTSAATAMTVELRRNGAFTGTFALPHAILRRKL